MGGIVFIVALARRASRRSCATSFTDLVLLVALCAAIGAIDDMLTIRCGREPGLARAHEAPGDGAGRRDLHASHRCGWGNAAANDLRTLIEVVPRDVLFHAGGFVLVAPHWLWLVLGILAITGTIHAVNSPTGSTGWPPER